MKDKIAIMGLGLMGGSLGLALKAAGYTGAVSAYARRESTRAKALECGIADQVHDDPVAAVRDADLVIYCTPILTIPALVNESRKGLKTGAILTDVGSTKAELASSINPVLAGTDTVFVGSHPVAGSEQQGMEAARADLYSGAVVVVTPQEEEREARAVDYLRRFWTKLGAVVRVIDARSHDQLMARTSHLPHLVASLLTTTTGRDSAYERVGGFCGTGFRDTSRIADGSPDVWHDIVCSNAGAIADELKAFRVQLEQLIAWTDAQEFDKVKAYLARARAVRGALIKYSPAEQ